MSFSEKYINIFNLVKEDITKIEYELTSEICLSACIDETLKDFLTQKTKRIRPLVSFLYLLASGKKIDECQYSFQTIIEIIHNASLIHDDVIDESDLRRGNTTINKKFNNKIAILTGDYLLSIALKKLNKLNSPEIIAICADTLEDMCQGEVNQYFNKYKFTGIEEYLKKTKQKTAKLFQTAVKGAMLLAGETDLTNADKFSLAFGIAFQIRDDILNLTETAKLKPAQNDIENGIYNAPVIFSGKTCNLDEGIAKTKSLLNNYVIEAIDALNNIDENPYKRAIIELLEILNDV